MERLKQIATVVGLTIAVITLLGMGWGQIQSYSREQIRDEQNHKTLEKLVEADGKKLEYIKAIDAKLDAVKNDTQKLKDAHPNLER